MIYRTDIDVPDDGYQFDLESLGWWRWELKVRRRYEREHGRRFIITFGPERIVRGPRWWAWRRGCRVALAWMRGELPGEDDPTIAPRLLEIERQRQAQEREARTSRDRPALKVLDEDDS